jgi:hypothetical protein
MGKKASGPKRKRNPEKYHKYRVEDRKSKNKIRRLNKQIEKLEKIKLRNPESKVDRSIHDLTILVKKEK